jgi:hypothetical protein
MPSRTGVGAWIHDCYIRNDDDSVAVKPAKHTDSVGSQNNSFDCTQNILIERVTMTGFGASIGSVSPEINISGACVRNVTFRDIEMPKTGKGEKEFCISTFFSSCSNFLFHDYI